MSGKFLIVGLGNFGPEYEHTRHNIGFDIANELANKYHAAFTDGRYANIAEFNIKGKPLVVIKPTTYMNLSGKSVRYWMQQHNIKTQQIFVLVDDIAIDFGKIRIKAGGSDAGHNGLKNINECLETQQYPRLRFGIGSNFAKGRQVEYVLGKFTPNEQKELPLLIEKSVQAIESFVLRGLEPTMNDFNRK
ncbi:MAG: aminoacyl-tRNA hydrolase [Bacteroidia bacterium]